MNTTSAGYVSFEFTGYVNTIGRDYYIFDVIGYKDFRDAESFVHYTVYLNCKGAFGGTLADNTITADVVARNQSADANLTFKLERNLAPNNTHKLWIGIDEGYSGIQILHYPTYIGDLTRVSASSFAFTSTEPTTTTVFPPSIPLLSTGGTMTGNLTLNSATPEILFNGTSDTGVDMAIKATPEGLDFYEPEQNNKIHFQILDDTGVNSPYGYRVGGVRKDLNWDTAYNWGDHASAGYQTDVTPSAPSVTATNLIGETIEIVFSQSSTSGVDRYEVWSNGGGSSYSLVGVIPQTDIASSMSFVDATFTDIGTIGYRVYAVRKGVYSTASTTNQAFSAPSLDVVNMRVVPELNTFHIEYDMPNTRLLEHVEIYLDTDALSTGTSRSNATLVYSGNETSYTHSISATDRDNYHQFWVECVGVS